MPALGLYDRSLRQQQKIVSRVIVLLLTLGSGNKKVKVYFWRAIGCSTNIDKKRKDHVIWVGVEI